MDEGWPAFTSFLEQVELARESLNLRAHQECFFRGHSDVSYQLKPSLYRNTAISSEACWKLERRVFFEFRTRARQLYEETHSDWDVLFHMQHHGVPTRLLDWTSVFGVALYFALLGHREATVPCLWLLNPYALNFATWGVHRLFNPKYLARDETANRSFEYGELLLDTHPQHWEERLWRTPLAISDHQRSERMFAQSGWFTVHGTDTRAMEDIFSDRGDVLRKVEVPLEAVPVAKRFLVLGGIGHRQLFPDLDGLARSVCQLFNLGSNRSR
jgi:hypothetical protein